MATLASTKSLDNTIPFEDKDRPPPPPPPPPPPVEAGATQSASTMAETTLDQQTASARLAIPKVGDHLYRRRSMTMEKHAARAPTELMLANGKPRRSIPGEMQLGPQTTHAEATHGDGPIPLPLASPVTITTASLTALSLSGHSEPPSPRTPTGVGFGNTALSSSPYSTPSSRPLSLISSVSVSTLSVPRNNFQASVSSSSSSSSASATSPKAPPTSSATTDTGLTLPGSGTDEKAVTSPPREQNSPRGLYAPISSTAPEALLSHHHHHHPPLPPKPATRPARRQTIQSDNRHAHVNAAKNGASGTGRRGGRVHARQPSSDIGLRGGGGGGRAGVGSGALSDSETLGTARETRGGAGVDQKGGSGAFDHSSTTASPPSHPKASQSSSTKSTVSAQLRVNLYSLVSRGYLPANITVAFREHSATITPHGTLVPIIHQHSHASQDEDKDATIAAMYPWLQQEYETPSAWATAMVKGARTGKVAVNGWSAIKVPLHQDPSLTKMYGGQGIHEVSLDVPRKKFLADLAGSGEDMGDGAGAMGLSKSASGSLSKANARQIAKELAMDGRKRKRQIGKAGVAGAAGGDGSGGSGSGSAAADANGLWILTSKLDSLAGQRQNSHHHHQHPRDLSGRVRGGGSRRPYKRSMPEYVLQDEDSLEDQQSRLEAAGTLFSMQDHYSSHQRGGGGGGEPGYGYRGYSTRRATDRTGGGLGPRTKSHRRIELQSVTKYFQAREAKRAAAVVPAVAVRRVTPLTLAARRSRDVCVVCKKLCQPSANSESLSDAGAAVDGVDTTSMDICKSENSSPATTHDIKQCVKCNTPAHIECTTSLPAIYDQDGWTCPRCIRCTVCERALLERPPNKASHSDLKMTILNCNECQEGVHLECQLELEPSLKAFVTAGSTCETLPEDFEWKCTSCRTCVECGYSCKNGAPPGRIKTEQQQQEGTPSSPEPVRRQDNCEGEDTEMADADVPSEQTNPTGGHSDDQEEPRQALVDGWTNGFSICPGCTRLFEMGNICPLCCRLYPEDDYDTPMVFCDGCSFWVHVACDSGLAGNDYEELGKDSKQYFCPSCNPTPMPSPALSTSSSSSSSTYPPLPLGGRYAPSNHHHHLASRTLQEWSRAGGVNSNTQASRYGLANKRDDIFDLIMAAKEISDSESRAQSPSLMDVDGSAAAAAAAAASMDSLAEVQAAEALLTIFSGSNTPVCSTPYASYPPSPYEPHFNHFGPRSSGYPALLESPMPVPPSYHQEGSTSGALSFKCGDCSEGMACKHYHYRQPPPPPSQQPPAGVFTSPRSSYSAHASDDYFSGQHRPSKRISYQHIGQELNHGTLLESGSTLTAATSAATPSSSSSSSHYPQAAVKREDAEAERQHSYSHGYPAAYPPPPNQHHHGYTTSSGRVGSSATSPTTPFGATTPGEGSCQALGNMHRPIQPNKRSPNGVMVVEEEEEEEEEKTPLNSTSGDMNEYGTKRPAPEPTSEELLGSEVEGKVKRVEDDAKNEVCALCRTKWTPHQETLGGWMTVQPETIMREDQSLDKKEKEEVEGKGPSRQLPWRVHRDCALWATGVSHGKESNQWMHAGSVIELSQTMTCSSCGHAGASIRCKASTTPDGGDRSYACAAIFHYPCVTRTAALPSSGLTQAVVVDEQERSILCRMHYREVSTLNDLRAAAAALGSSNGSAST